MMYLLLTITKYHENYKINRNNCLIHGAIILVLEKLISIQDNIQLRSLRFIFLCSSYRLFPNINQIYFK